MHADRTNRFLLTLIGAVALAVGVAGLLLAAGVFGRRLQGSYLVNNTFCRYIGRHGNWVWPAIGCVAFILVLLALWWLAILLLSTDRAGDVRLTPPRSKDETRRGRTIMAASALVDAVTDEIAGYHGVTGARGRILGDSTHPTLALDITASRRADLADLAARIQHDAVAHARTALDQADLRAIINLNINDKTVIRTR